MVLALAAGGLAIVLAAFLVVLILFYPFFFKLWEKIYGLSDLADQLFFAPTEDGWHIALHFHRPNYPRPGAYPVVVVHGIAANKYTVDMDRGHSLAYFLKQNGFPVFAISLRGCGKSHHNSKYGYKDYNFDDMVEKDIPAIIDRVKELTGAPKVNWVGHSMGAMIMYGFQARELEGHKDIAAMVALGSPGRLTHAKTSLWGAVSKHPGLTRALDAKWSAQLVSPFAARIATPVEDIIFNREIVSGVTIRRLMKNGVENIPPALMEQFVRWINDGHTMSVDGGFDYSANYDRIKTPALFIAGARDHIAPAESVRYVYKRHGGEHKDYKLMGKEAGKPYDYCHTGLVLADRANIDVFPEVLEWLLKYGREKKRRGFWGRIFRRWDNRFGKKKKESPVSRARKPGSTPGDVISA